MTVRAYYAGIWFTDRTKVVTGRWQQQTTVTYILVPASEHGYVVAS
jgi:hypothetical protein